MELYQLRYFIKVAEMEHMTFAAKELGLSEPALSRAIRQLEEELGVKLFERRGRNIILTESGNVMLVRSREILRDLAFMQAEVQNVQRESQPVRLVARAAASLIPGLIDAFKKEHPDIVVSIIQNDNHIIRSQEYDLMIGGSILQPPKYTSIVLLDDPFRVLLSKNHPLARKETIMLEELEGENMIGLSPNRYISAVIRQVLEEYHVHVQYQLYSDDPLMIRNLVEYGQGVCILPTFALREVDKKNLCEREIDQRFPELHLVLSWNKDAYQPEAVRIFRKFTKKYFAQMMVKQGSDS